jgi:hypothetical protein
MPENFQRNNVRTKDSNNNKNVQESDMIGEIVGICMRTKIAVDEIKDQVDKIIGFHEDQTEKGSNVSFTSNVERIKGIENLKNISGGLSESNKNIQDLLSQLKQARTITKKTSVGLTAGGSKVEDEDD